MNLNVQAFLIFERVAACDAFEVSVLLQADEQLIGKTSLGTFAGGQVILLSLHGDQTTFRSQLSVSRNHANPVLHPICIASGDSGNKGAYDIGSANVAQASFAARMKNAPSKFRFERAETPVELPLLLSFLACF